MDYLFSIAIGLLVFFLFSLVRKPEKDFADRVFMTWLILLVINEVGFILYAQSKLVEQARYISFAFDTLILHIPLLYIYAKAFSQPKLKFQWKMCLHLLTLLPLIVSRYIISSYDLYSYDINRLDININSLYNTLTYIYKYCVMMIYLLLAHKVIFKHKAQVDNAKDAIRNIWIKQLFSGALFLFISIISLQVLRFIFPVPLYDRMSIISILSTLFVFPVLYLANSQGILLNNRVEKIKRKSIETYSTSTKEEQETVANITAFMHDKKPYLDSTLTIKNVAEALDVPQRQISQSINNVTSNSFTYFINTFRVKHLTNLLKDESKRQYTIISLAEESGFSSKSTLVRIFKQHTNMTPSEYLSRLEE